MNTHKHCPECGEYWDTSNVYSNTAQRIEHYSCKNAHRWVRTLRFTGYAADGTRCYTTAPPAKTELKRGLF